MYVFCNWFYLPLPAPMPVVGGQGGKTQWGQFKIILNFSQLKNLFWVIYRCFKKTLPLQSSLLSQKVGRIGKSSVSLKHWRRSFRSSYLPSGLLGPLAFPAACWFTLLLTTGSLLLMTVMSVDCASISAGHKVSRLLCLLTHLHYRLWKCSPAFSALPYWNCNIFSPTHTIHDAFPPTHLTHLFLPSTLFCYHTK